MPFPQQWIVEGMQERILGCKQRLCMGVGLHPACAMDDDLGVLLADQRLGALGGGLWHDHGNRDIQPAPGIGNGDPGIAAGGGNKALLSFPGIALAGRANATNLEGTARLQGIELEPDVLPREQAQRA
ncbi:hypothetical protein D3C80_1501160 [compost metagenome]